MKKILFPSEFGPLAQKAEPAVAQLGKSIEAEVLLMHAIPRQSKVRLLFGGDPEMLKLEANEQLESEASRLREGAGIQVNTMVGLGRPDEAILEAATESGADLIMFGTKGREGLRASIFGSPVKNVVEKAPCPCLTFRETPGKDLFSNLLVVLDPEEPSLLHLEWAALIAASQKAEIQLLSHYNGNKFTWEDCAKLMDLAEQKAKDKGVQEVKRIDLPWGSNPVQDIFIAAKELQTDLIVLLDSQWNEEVKANSVIESLTTEIVEMSDLPVLTARSSHRSPFEH